METNVHGPAPPHALPDPMSFQPQTSGVLAPQPACSKPAFGTMFVEAWAAVGITSSTLTRARLTQDMSRAFLSFIWLIPLGPGRFWRRSGRERLVRARSG